MENFNDSNDEIIKFASEVLKWELPLILSQDNLDHLKLLAASSVTHSHDFLKFGRTAAKSKISIAQLVDVRKQMRLPR